MPLHGRCLRGVRLEANGLQHELKRAKIESRTQQQPSAMPLGLVNNLTPDQLADLVGYLQSLK